MDTVRDRLWMFSVEPTTDDRHYGIPQTRITPIESCGVMGVPNLMMIVNEQLEPKPPLANYFRALRPLKQVAWSIVGSGGIMGWAGGRELETLRDLAVKFPNLTGVYMDDFYNERSESGSGTLALSRLREIRDGLTVPSDPPRTLDLWVVLYTHQLDMQIGPSLEYIDIVNLWTWWARDIPKMPENLAKLEQIAPKNRLSLGLYLYDYGDRKPMPVDLMKEQCEFGLEALRKGRVESLVFLGSYLCDQDWAAVEWTREWIARVADQPVSG